MAAGVQNFGILAEVILPTITKNITSKDKNALKPKGDIAFIPKRSATVLSVAAEAQKATQATSDATLERTKKLVDGYVNFVNEIDKRLGIIAKRSTGLFVDIDPVTQPEVATAVKLVFGQDLLKIDFDMYQKCLELDAQLSAELVNVDNVK